MSETKSSLSRRDFGLCASGFLALLGASGADAVLNRNLHDPAAEQAAAARLELIPERIGKWVSTLESIDEHEKRMAEIVGSVRRTYRNSETGYVVSMTILCGASGPMSVHPPTACFEGVGYELSSGPSVIAFVDNDESQSTLNRASFRLPGSPLSEVVRVFWGWSDDGNWTAPANPRLAFRGQPYLYKLYVVDRLLPQTDDALQSEAFLEEALPAIRSGVQQR
jgi:hypothetical protein